MKYEFNLEKDEYVFGLTANDGLFSPYKEGFKRDLNIYHAGNQASAMIVTTFGRYIYSNKPFAFEMKKDSFVIESDDEIKFIKAGETMRDAYLDIKNKYFINKQKTPDLEMFRKPQYNTWIEMPYDCTQEKVLKYANEIIDNGFPAGVLMIDDCWCKDYGVWDFDKAKFDNPKQMIEQLHQLGFKVMLWCCPFVSPDSSEFRKLEQLGYLVKNQDDSTFLSRWWNGYSAIYDLSNKDAFNYFKNVLISLMDKYGVDGFKIDAGDPEYYRLDNKFKEDNIVANQAKYLSILGEYFSLSELRVGFNNGVSPVANRLRDKNHSWDNEGINTLINDGLSLSLLGYPFICPDMIGGGMLLSFETSDFKFDQELFVRYSFVACLFPMMQFSISPWKVLDKKHLEMVKKSIKIHDEYVDDILQIVEQSRLSGEPMMRYLSYNDPDPLFATVDDEFLLGENILVVPMIKKGTKRKMVVPQGNWVDSNGNNYQKGIYDVEIPLDEIIVLRRK